MAHNDLDEGWWTCPVCRSLCGPAVEDCEGFIDIPDPELGETELLDATHSIVWRPKPHDGWVYYGANPFVENLDRIVRLVGSSLYEVSEADGHAFVRRI